MGNETWPLVSGIVMIIAMCLVWLNGFMFYINPKWLDRLSKPLALIISVLPGAVLLAAVVLFLLRL